MIPQHEILEAAKEAGFSPNMSYTLLPMIDYVNFEASEIIKRFAAIIERRTIERCAVVCEMRALKLLGETEYESAKYCAAAICKLGEQ